MYNDSEGKTPKDLNMLLAKTVNELIEKEATIADLNMVLYQHQVAIQTLRSELEDLEEFLGGILEENDNLRQRTFTVALEDEI